MNAPPCPAWRCVCLSSALVACSGPPFTLERANGDSGAPDAAGDARARDESSARAAGSPVVALPLRSPATGVLGQAPRDAVEIGFAAHASGALAAFNPQTGAVLALHALDGALEDVAWDPRQARVVIVTREPHADGSRVRSLDWDGGFVERAVSEPLDGVARAFPLADALLVAARDIGTSWTPLDDALVATAPSHASIDPAGLVPLEARTALVLAAAWDGTNARHVSRIDFGTLPWGVVSTDIADAGASSARLAENDDGAWLVRLDDAGRLGLARITTAGGDCSVQSFDERVLPVIGATLAGVEWQPAAGAFAVTLARGAGGSEPGVLALVPANPTRAPQALALPGAVEGTSWPSRSLARSDGGRVLVATSSGIFAFDSSGWSPPLRDTSFSAPALSGPMALGVQQ